MLRNKFLHFVTVATIVVSCFPVSVFAVSPSPKVTITQKKIDREETTLNRLKERGKKEIDRRIESLNNLIDKINKTRQISSEQKVTLVNKMQQEIAALTALKVKIEAGTEVDVVREDIQSIVKSYRIYLLFVPQLTIIAHADHIIEVAHRIKEMDPSLQELIDKAKAAGKDTASVIAMMNERSTKIADAISQSNNAINAVIALTPEGYPGNKTILSGARDMLKTAREDLRVAHKDGQKIRQALKEFRPTPTPTATQ